jgi:hypothetical protein
MVWLHALLWQRALGLPAALRQASRRQVREFLREGGLRPASLLLLGVIAVAWVISVIAFLWWLYPYIIER